MSATGGELCRVCSDRTRYVFTLPLLGRTVDYFDSGCCGYLQTEQPTWLNEAYRNPITDVDTVIMMRNRSNVWRGYLIAPPLMSWATVRFDALGLVAATTSNDAVVFSRMCAIGFRRQVLKPRPQLTSSQAAS